MLDIVSSHVFLTTFVCTVVLWRRSLGAVEVPVITRDTYDLIQFPNCAGRGKSSDFNCDEVIRYGVSTGDPRTCTCKCREGYAAFRDPFVSYRDNNYQYNVNQSGCVWYGLYEEGCHILDSLDEITYRSTQFPRPIVIDLTERGNITLKSSHYSPGEHCNPEIVPYVRKPKEDKWNEIHDVKFSLVKLGNKGDSKNFALQWTRQSNDIYAYQGLIMRLDFQRCFQPPVMSHCVMIKIAGTYTEDKSCKRRTMDGRCCVFPFVYKGTLHNECITTEDMTGEWCAVGLNTNVNKGNHKWRENCAGFPTFIPAKFPPPSTTDSFPEIPASPSPTSSSSNTDSSAELTTNILPMTSSQPSTSDSSAVRQRITTEPTTNQDTPKPAPTVIRVTVHIPCSKPALPGDPAPGSRRSDSDFDMAAIIAVSVLLILLLLVAILLVIYVHRRKMAGRNIAKKTLSSEMLTEEASYGNFQGGTPPQTKKLTNFGFQESVEMKLSRASTVTRGEFSYDSGHPSSLYDNLTMQGKPIAEPHHIYSIPEADYSLITKHANQPKLEQRPLPSPLPSPSPSADDSSHHVYSVLERNHDPMKSPEPTDNDKVFVEANPIYGIPCIQKEQDKATPDEEEEFDEPSEVDSSNNIYDVPEGIDKAV